MHLSSQGKLAREYRKVNPEKVKSISQGIIGKTKKKIGLLYLENISISQKRSKTNKCQQ